MKIAFHMMGGESWTVGPIYLRNLFHAVRQRWGKQFRLSLLAPVGQQNTQAYARFIEADDVILYNIPRYWSSSWAINGLIKRLLSRDIMMGKILRKRRVNVVFGPSLVYRYGKVAMLAWLPDFQHLHLPEMFSKAQRLSRDQTFLQCAKLATRIILMTNAAKRDFRSFAPRYIHKVRVLHPVSYVPQSIYDYDLNSILNLYHLPEKFVYLPNQFWKHKNHELIFRAVKILKDRGVRVFVVCTGNPMDSRHPTYFTDLWQKLSQWNIRDRIVYLGLIPYEHVFLLMRQSICVLNPSLFEGWGYTVDEARSVGKQVLLSDIPTHREQNPPKTLFFDPHNCQDLVEKLRQIWEETAPGPKVEFELEARRTLPKRLGAYGEAFVSVAREAIEEVKS